MDIEDYLGLTTDLTDRERQLRDRVREFVDQSVRPHIVGWWETGIVPREVIRGIAQLGVFGALLPGKDGRGAASPLGWGLMLQELERGDSGLRSIVSVQTSLVMQAIFQFGSASQQAAYLPALATADLIGCFGLTEAGAGSDPWAMASRCWRTATGWRIVGSKRWITNGTIADIAILWAKDTLDGHVRGFLVPTHIAGFQVKAIAHKGSMRASSTAELDFDLEVPEAFYLPGAKGLGDVLSCLTEARFGICWGTVGAALDCLQEARDYALDRWTFGRPAAGTQLVQAHLANMLESVVGMQLIAWQLAKLKQHRVLRFPQVSLAKRQNARAGLQVARTAREVMGANGISLECNSFRHMVNLETVDTYEGTYEIQTLVVGRDITGLAAF